LRLQAAARRASGQGHHALSVHIEGQGGGPARECESHCFWRAGAAHRLGPATARRVGFHRRPISGLKNTSVPRIGAICVDFGQHQLRVASISRHAPTVTWQSGRVPSSGARARTPGANGASAPGLARRGRPACQARVRWGTFPGQWEDHLVTSVRAIETALGRQWPEFPSREDPQSSCLDAV